ncbi:hypothetical protein MA16_Dca026490 [Dendrobium catenatum]|uniref:Uncharacterized protein n=1 Tax=Dendrobium catenatum TaxID=906689 RepID=A0A2I0WJF3_9ASPA|nr:hypothetical protein MA16_Dca026490 [Dendrobium catenatum]
MVWRILGPQVLSDKGEGLRWCSSEGEGLRWRSDEGKGLRWLSGEGKDLKWWSDESEGLRWRSGEEASSFSSLLLFLFGSPFKRNEGSIYRFM